MLTRRQFAFAPLALWQAARRQRLNVLLVLVDDYGCSDLSCYGSTFYETPNLDRLAGQGMRFTQAYSACTVCSPSRAAIMTGKYPARLHLTDWIAGHNYPWAKLRPPDWTKYLPLEERTLAEALKPSGYATASIGKWHLAPPSRDPAFYPDHQGFDANFGGTFRGQPPSYFSPYGIETLKDGPPGEYLTDREQLEASRFMSEHTVRNPFFVYLPHHTVHTPLQAKADIIAKYKRKARPDAPQHNPTYAAMIQSLDENVGRLVAALDKTGAADSTVVILTGDNGGWLPSTNTNLGVRAGKGSAYEGGVRVPMIVRWPGVVRPGSVCDVPVMGIDIYPTVLDMVGLRPESGQILDGASIVPLLRGQSGSWHRDELFWHYPHYHPGGATPYSAIRQRDWKLIEFQEDGRTELYHLKEDPEEKKDLSTSDSGRASKLRALLNDWRKEVGAQLAEQNPNYDPARATERPAPPKPNPGRGE